jgi:uncharacterized protein
LFLLAAAFPSPFREDNVMAPKTPHAALSPFVWYDVMVEDVPAAQKFYTGLTGWTVRDTGMENGYVVVSKGATMVGGILPIPADSKAAGVRPAWMGYIGVSDVDVTAKRITSEGGTVHKPPQDIPGIGRFAVVADPHGAGFIIFQPNSTEAPIPVADGTPGHFGWHELYAGDREQALAFYATLFGWTKSQAIESPAGPYQTFAAGAAPIGGMMTRPAHIARPHWLYYINVASVTAAIAYITSHGGKVLHGPMEVPTGKHIAQCLDPQGAAFAIIGPKL